MSPASPRPSAGAGEWRRPVIAERIEGEGTGGVVGATTGPLDCSGAGSLVVGGSGACTGTAAAARGVGGSGLTFSVEDFAGSAGGSDGSIGLAGSEGTADWWTTLSDSTGVESVTGSFDSITEVAGAGAAEAGVLGLQSLVEEVW